MLNQAEAKRDSVINQQNYNFKQLYTENFDALKHINHNFEILIWLCVIPVFYKGLTRIM